MNQEIDVIVATIERVQSGFDDLVMRGLRTAGPDQLALLEAMHEEFARIGASHIAGRIADLLEAVRADDRHAGSALLRAQSSLRVFERILTLESAAHALEGLTAEPGTEDEDDNAPEDGEDDGDDEA